MLWLDVLFARLPCTHKTIFLTIHNTDTVAIESYLYSHVDHCLFSFLFFPSFPGVFIHSIQGLLVGEPWDLLYLSFFFIHCLFFHFVAWRVIMGYTISALLFYLFFLSLFFHFSHEWLFSFLPPYPCGLFNSCVLLFFVSSNLWLYDYYDVQGEDQSSLGSFVNFNAIDRKQWLQE